MLPSSNKKYECETCDYICYNKTNFDKHLVTRKHNNTDKCLQKNEYSCQCGKVYKHRQSLSTHKKSCVPVAPATDITVLTNLVIELMKNNNELKQQSYNFQKQTQELHKQSNDFQQQLLEIYKNGNTVVTNNSVTNNNNQKFNINVFLTEQCKDAINFSDFIKNIEVSREDLENNAQLGFVDGVSKILIHHLKQMSVNERPIHCTDVKRETMYIKDEDKWTREEDSTKINKAIQEVTRKSMGTLMNWKEENPDYKDRDSEFSERCIVIQQQSMAAHNRDTYYPRVVKAVAKEVIVDKK